MCGGPPPARPVQNKRRGGEHHLGHSGPQRDGPLLPERKARARSDAEVCGRFPHEGHRQDQLVGSLSGGNQQKVVIGRALSTKPKLVILDEPTRGIDAAARGDVYSIIAHLRDEGVAVLLISSDMEEIVELSDRAVTVYQGRINAEFQKCDINQDNLMAAAFGVTDGKKVEA